jgi:hypothetical protein
MKQWIRANWAGGSHGKRQVILAGVLSSLLLGAVSYMTWDTVKPPSRYRVVLEGEDRQGHFFTVLAVASPSVWQARPLAVAAARRQGIDVVGVQEIQPTGPAPRARRWGVLKAPWDRVYFPTEHYHHGHDHED